MNESHITARCLLGNSPHREYIMRDRNTHCGDILKECDKGVLIL